MRNYNVYKEKYILTTHWWTEDIKQAVNERNLSGRNI